MAKVIPACRLPCWRTTVRVSTILKTNDTNIDKEIYFKQLLTKFVHMKLKSGSLDISSTEKIKTHIDSASPQISIMAHQCDAECSNTA